MPWGKNVESTEVKEYKAAARELIADLEDRDYKLPRMNVLRVSLYKVIKRCFLQGIASPTQILLSVRSNSELYDLIYHCQWKEFVDKIHAINEDEYTYIVMATIFYTAYYDTKSFARAVLSIFHYKFQRFSRIEIHNLFTKYPFLRNTEHLNHVVTTMDRIKYATKLTKCGLKEQYEVIV
jgi:hypothetical protein